MSDALSAPEGAIAAAQRRCGELFDLDLSALWRWAARSRRYLTLTHLHRSADR